MLYYYGSKLLEKYSRGRRGAPAKGIGRETGARVQIPPSPFIHKYPFWCLCAGKTDWELLLGGEFPVCLFLCHKRIRFFLCILLAKSIGNRYVEGFFPIFFIAFRNVNVIN